jgi:hypothetical protein
MASPVDDRGVDAFQELLQAGGRGRGAKTEALEALSLRPVWLATWEPKAEGYRTLINAEGEEALAVFSSEDGLKSAAAQFDWLEPDGSLATHRAIGGDILRHAWTREYAFVVIDIGSPHSLEYERGELKTILRELDSTGPFRTSAPPPPPPKKAASGSFAPPKEQAIEHISTMYSMAPSQSEKLDRLSDIPTKPYELPHDSEPPTQPRAALPEREPPSRRRRSSRPASKPKSEPPGAKIEEIGATPSALGDRGTYGAASIIPSSHPKPKSRPPSPDPSSGDDAHPESVSPMSSSAPKLNSEAPTAPAAQPLPTLQPGKLKLPAVGPIGAGGVEPKPPSEAPKAAPRQTETPPAKQPPRVVAPSIGDGIKLVELFEPPDEELLSSLASVLRGYFEVEWASYCHVGRPAGGPSPAIGLRIDDNYRDNVTAIIKDLCEAARKHEIEIDVLLIDGHDLLRKSRERAVVFYPWKPKS